MSVKYVSIFDSVIVDISMINPALLKQLKRMFQT